MRPAPLDNIWCTIFVVRRHHADAPVDGCRDIAEELLDLRVALDPDQRVVAARHDPLAENTWIQLSSPNNSSFSRKIAAVGAPEVDLILQRLGQFHRPAIFPEVAVALVRPIMEHDEVAHALPLEIALAVEFVDRRLVGRAIGKQPNEPDRSGLDKVDAGRFQRLEEVRRQAERDAIAVPHLSPLAAREAKPVGLGQLLAVEVGEKQRLGAIVVDMLAGIDEAIAGAVLERNAPLPAGARARSSAYREVSGRSARTARPSRGRRAASGPVLVAGLQRLLDQQSAKARAIDEEVGRDLGRLRA